MSAIRTHTPRDLGKEVGIRRYKYASDQILVEQKELHGHKQPIHVRKTRMEANIVWKMVCCGILLSKRKLEFTEHNKLITGVKST